MASKVYVVFIGRKVGVFYHWEKAEAAIYKWPHAKHKFYKTADEAWTAWKHFRVTGETPY